MSKRKKRVLMRVAKGSLVPADALSARQLRAQGVKMGEDVAVEIYRARNAAFHRKVHAFGQLIADNLDDFEGMDCHAVIKRLQWESGIGCEEMGAKVPGVGYVQIRIPRSMAFSEMDESEFEEVYRGLCRHVSGTYWTSLDEDAVAAMIEIMPEEAA